MWELDYKESWALKNNAFELWCWRRLLWVPLTARRFNQSILKKSVLNINWKDWCWSWNSSTLATWCEVLTYLKRPWCWEGLRAGGEGDDRGWDSWMTLLTQWTWVWVNSGSWWWTGRPGMLQSIGSQGVRHEESNTTEWLNWTELNLVETLEEIVTLSFIILEFQYLYKESFYLFYSYYPANIYWIFTKCLMLHKHHLIPIPTLFGKFFYLHFAGRENGASIEQGMRWLSRSQ